MPTLVPLDQLPNQSLQMILGGNRFDFTLKKTVEVMVIDISRNEELIVQGMRCLPETPLMPYLYQEDFSGNFYFTTHDDNFPDYFEFGVTQYLWFFSNDELVELRV
jgi:hypothetical protein